MQYITVIILFIVYGTKVTVYQNMVHKQKVFIYISRFLDFERSDYFRYDARRRSYMRSNLRLRPFNTRLYTATHAVVTTASDLVKRIKLGTKLKAVIFL